jgi:hypothetical protein
VTGVDELWRVTDPLGHTVVLTLHRWDHILRRRPWFRRYATILRHACSSPEAITAEGNRLYYYRAVARQRDWRYVIACVEDGNPRRVMTAYLVDRFRKGEFLIWPRP